jgi:hypothetical protein
MERPFKLMDKVLVIELRALGRVMAIHEGFCGTTYEVRYFHNGQAYQVCFIEDELKKQD